jgi:NitT/TauT family transport system substrate-binding protein
MTATLWEGTTMPNRNVYRSTRPVRAAKVAATLVVLAGLVAGCGNADSAAASGDQVTFVTVKGALEWWPVQFGIEQGSFKDAGLDVETVQAKSGPEITSIVTSGSADVGMGVLEAAVVPIDQGAEMTILDIPGVTPSTSVIAAPGVELPHADAGYPASVTDLAGLKIGLTALGSPMERYLTAVLKDAGLGPDDVTFVAVGGPATALPAFTEGKIDALVAYDPLTQMLGDGAFQTVVTADDMVRHATGPVSGVYFFGSSGFAESDAARTFCGAVLKAYDAIKAPANEDAAVDSLAAWTGLSPEKSDVVLTSLKERIGDATIDDKVWSSAGDFLTSQPPAYDKAVTPVCG